MMNAQSFADAYAEYMTRNDKTVMINGKRYWRIVDKSKLTDFEVIVLPSDACGKKMEDEMGNEFHVSVPVEYNFKGEVPQWYKETVSLMLMDIEIKRIGNYVCIIE